MKTLEINGYRFINLFINKKGERHCGVIDYPEDFPEIMKAEIVERDGKIVYDLKFEIVSVGNFHRTSDPSELSTYIERLKMAQEALEAINNFDWSKAPIVNI